MSSVQRPRVVARPATAEDADAWLELRDALWPGSRQEHTAEIEEYFADPRPADACFVAEVTGRGVVGFAEVRLREYAEDCLSSPVGYLEGIYVAPDERTAGVGRVLVEAVEEWARSRGCTEMASDRELDNEASGAFHVALGYRETVRMVCCRKDLWLDHSRGGGA